MLIPLGMTLLLAAAWAKLEIEIEGRDGWAASLPTWRIDAHPLLDIFWGGRPMTGYHVWAFLTVLGFYHLPFAWGLAWSLAGELRVLAFYAIFWIVEDYLWFAWNPAFGLGRFRREFIWWHKRWFLGAPVDYWIFGSAAIIVLGSSLAGWI